MVISLCDTIHPSTYRTYIHFALFSDMPMDDTLERTEEAGHQNLSGNCRECGATAMCTLGQPWCE